VQRDALERENDIEELRKIALALHVANAQLIVHLRAQGTALAKYTGNAAALQQTLALINTLVAQQTAVAGAAAAPAPAALTSTPPDAPPRGPRARTGPTPQPQLPVVPRLFELDLADQACTACGQALRP